MTTMTQIYSDVPQGVGLRDIRAIWARRKWLILLTFLTPFLLITSAVLAMPDFYRSSVTILVQPDQNEDSARLSAPGQLEARLQAISEEILSRSSLLKLINKHDLYPELRDQLPPEAVVDRMKKDIRLKRKSVDLQWGDDATVAFTLSYQGWDPGTVAEMTNTLAGLFIEENEKHRQLPESEKDTDTRIDPLVELKQKLRELRTRYSDRYPDVIRTKAKIAAIEAERRRVGSSQTTSKQKNKITKPEKQLSIVDAALPPKKAVAPGRMRLIIMALVLAVGMAVVLTFIVEKFNNTFYRLEDLWSFTTIPVLAAIPQIQSRRDIWRRRIRFLTIALLVIIALLMLIRASNYVGQESEQIVWLLAQRGI